MNIQELHSKYIKETNKHPINENSKDGAYSDEYVSWLQNIVVNNNDLHLVSDCECREEDQVEEDGELYCSKCNDKWD